MIFMCVFQWLQAISNKCQAVWPFIICRCICTMHQALGTRLTCTHTCMYTASLILKLYAGMSLMVCVCISYCKWWMLCKLWEWSLWYAACMCVCISCCKRWMLVKIIRGVCVCVRRCVHVCVRACVRACIVPPLTSFPAGRESSFESCRWWGLPTALSQCLQRTQCDRCIPTSCADRSPANYI